MRIIGYSRVSKINQNLDLQRQAIMNYAEKKGIENVVLYEEKVSSRKNRPELEQAKKAMTEGDIFVCYKIDRVARSVRELASFVEELESQNIKFVSTSDDIDLSTSGGKLMFHMLASVAEFERNLIRERTMGGLDAARKQGRVGGRPAVDEEKKKAIYRLFKAGEPVTSIAKTFNISRPTVYSIVKKFEENEVKS